MDYLQNNNLLEDTQLSENAKVELSNIARWANTSAILAFVSIGVSFMSLIFTFTRISSFGSRGAILGGGVFTFLLGTGISLLLGITLFNAAKYLKAGLLESDQGYFLLGASKLATYFKINAILIIIIAVIIVLVLLLLMLAAAFGGFR